MAASPGKSSRIRFLLAGLAVLAGVALTFEPWHGVGWAAAGHGWATILPPSRIGGASGYNDERDVDFYPAVAYDAATKRYLAVWMTTRNASSSTDGFDVFGVFLNQDGQRSGGEFRISDSNTAARNGFAAVAAGNGEFVVAWTVRGSPARINVQRIVDSSIRLDRVLISAAGHCHSPSLAYNAGRQRYALAYVEGDDYLPPTIMGAQTADCGNNASSTSRIKGLVFHFEGDNPRTDAQVDISDAGQGAFRPCLAYNADLNQYLAVWEDRRDARGQAHRFDVYAQRLNMDMTPQGSDILLASGGDYTNYDTSATWTARPVVAGCGGNFLTAWFARQTTESAVVWSVQGCLVPASHALGTPFTIAQTTFAQSHAGHAPTGFLATAGVASAQEYLVGMTMYLESVWGYLSLALVQRVAYDGQLLKLDGSLQARPGVGSSVDYQNDDQIGVGMAVNPASAVGTVDYVVAYSKHSAGRQAQDFDIWGVRIQLTAPAATETLTSAPTQTLTPTPTEILTPTPTGTVTPLPPWSVYLPIVMRSR